MLTDKGFSHAIAKAVLEDDPWNAEAVKLLTQPENKIVYEDGTIIDLSKVKEEEAMREGIKRQLTRMAL